MPDSDEYPVIGSTTNLARPQSEQVYDLHVYLVPPDLWRQNLHSAINEVIADSISLGFIRVSPRICLIDIRQEIADQIGDEDLPKDYVFLKSVGRCLTQVKTRQEKELRAKHFLPPYAYTPEIFLLDGHSEAVRASPSTISLSEHGSRSHRTDSIRNTQILTNNYPALSTQSPRRYPNDSQDNMSSNSTMGSQYFDAANTARSGGYPSYGQPYSHDISAITNAHRNNVNNHHGDELYPSNHDNSSGYKTLSPSGKSPHVSDDGPLSPTHQSGNRSSTNNPSNKHTGHYDERNRTSINNNSNDNGYGNGNEYSEERHQQQKSRNRTYEASDPVEAAEPEPSSNFCSDGNPSPRERNNFKDRHSKRSNREREERTDVDTVDQTGRELVSATPTGGSSYQHRRAESNAENNPSHQGNRGNKSYRGDKFESIPPGAKHPDDSQPYHEDDINQSANGKISDEKRDLLKQLEALKEQRQLEEKKRTDLVKKARALQVKTNNQRNQARERWKKKYYEEKKKTPALEAESQKVRATLEGIHKKYLSALDASEAKEDQAVEEATYQYHVDELQRKADAAKMKLTAEMKLRNQAETELRALRAELTQKKMSVTIARNQQMNALGNSRA